MRYRPIITPPRPSQAAIESPEIMEAAAFVESGEDILAMLAELARYGMELAQFQRDYARARLAAVAADGLALNPGEDPTAAFNKIAQTVRRTIALQLQLKEDVSKRRSGVTADRAARRARQAADHAGAVRKEIRSALAEAYHSSSDLPDDDDDDLHSDPGKLSPRECEAQEMLQDAEDLLLDPDEYGDWLNRPVGETVSRLCVALGLSPDSCIRQGDRWLVRRGDTEYETLLDKRGAPLSSLPQSGEGQTATPSGWGAAGKSPPLDAPAPP